MKLAWLATAQDFCPSLAPGFRGLASISSAHVSGTREEISQLHVRDGSGLRRAWAQMHTLFIGLHLMPIVLGLPKEGLGDKGSKPSRKEGENGPGPKDWSCKGLRQEQIHTTERAKLSLTPVCWAVCVCTRLNMWGHSKRRGSKNSSPALRISLSEALAKPETLSQGSLSLWGPRASAF